ncbi:hypothetical protein B296_00018106 [Ensete ventricosum]|uniref:Uncharacterized protein n=1 Tax=Ensete ventricosum TaxID=4639 RepID=A0A426YVE9_ENSVE|nr:hypothetical protein B296_00018106 [Ensete ventricosum]
MELSMEHSKKAEEHNTRTIIFVPFAAVTVKRWRLGVQKGSLTSSNKRTHYTLEDAVMADEISLVSFPTAVSTKVKLMSIE